ncbi:MAG: glycosyltransferase family 2 protein [Rhodobacteraceae bacterium]|nr:glycosyltransferase family 2 protein [Paracoccaceae bacterium]
MRLLAITCMRDEGPFVLDWVAHHRALGVGRFLVFTNDCTDGTDAVLEALEPAGVVHVPQTVAPDASPQWQALEAAFHHPETQAADWLLGIDCDEFVNLRPPVDDLPGLVAACPSGTRAIVLPWRLFGAGGRADFADAPVPDLFVRAAPLPCRYPVAASFFKTLVATGPHLERLGVHRPRLAEGTAWADGSGRVLDGRVAARRGRINLWGLPPAHDLVQLNHYALRSAESFMIKRARGLPNRRGKPVDAAYWIERNLNAVEDTSIARHAAARAAERARLVALPGVAEAHAAAVAAHGAAFRRLMANEEEWRLYGRLLLARDSVTPPEADLRRLFALRQEAARAQA